jgi:hypothetical protein
VATQFQDIFCNFYFAKIHKIANNSETPEAREKNKDRLEVLGIFIKKIDEYLTKFAKNYIIN